MDLVCPVSLINASQVQIPYVYYVCFCNAKRTVAVPWVSP